ncbi:TPA: DUF4222 domain-containing protein [Enterobacter hormaechei]|nr:DUF4222 domain-containing protein [Enterobacter hormaechei]HBL6104912.1 DUF4222 domain-containing protein [Enterobacter hormaechei]HBL9172324.1 DUF4222 domain-containing protein [Enterobacter hormaechei]
MAEVDRRFRDHRGITVHVIRWEPETRRVIYLREGYDHECFSPLEQFQRKMSASALLSNSSVNLQS